MADEHDTNHPDGTDQSDGPVPDQGEAEGVDTAEGAVADHESSSGEPGDEPGPTAPTDPDGWSDTDPDGFDDVSGYRASPSSGRNRRRGPSQAYINSGVRGRLVLHYPARTIELVLDGDAGLRCLAVLSGQGHPDCLDSIDPESSSAQDGWAMVDSTALLAAEWVPGIDQPAPSRITVDP